MSLADNASLLGSTEQLSWWLRPALCIMKLMFSRSYAAQSCLLPPQSTEGQTAHHYTTRLCPVFSSLFTALYYVLSFSSLSLSPLTLSHYSLGKWGGNDESCWEGGGYKKACVCVCASTHTCISWATVWFSRVGCETWVVGREREELQQHDTDSTGQRPSSLSLFSSFCPWSDTTAAPDTEHHPWARHGAQDSNSRYLIRQ